MAPVIIDPCPKMDKMKTTNCALLYNTHVKERKIVHIIIISIITKTYVYSN